MWHRARRHWPTIIAALAVLFSSVALQPRAQAAVGATQFRLPEGRQLLDSWASPTGQIAVTDVGGAPSRSTLYLMSADASLVFKKDFLGVVKDVTFAPNGDIYAVETTLNEAGTGYTAQVTRWAAGLGLASSQVFPDSSSAHLEFGADGFVYAVIWSNARNYLTVLRPDTLDTVRQVPLGDLTWFHARRDGLVAVNYAALATFLPYATLTPSPYPSSDGGVGESVQVSVAADADVFLLGLTWDRTRGDFPCDRGVAAVRRIDGSSWRFGTASYFDSATSSCKLSDIEALPGGGAVISAIDGFDARLRWVDDDGDLVTSFDYTPSRQPVGWTEMSSRRTDLTVDNSGRVVLAVTVPDGPCPEGQFGQFDCSRLDVVGLQDGALLFNTSVYGDKGNDDPQDDATALYDTGYLQQQELTIVGGAVVLPLSQSGAYPFQHYLSIASVPAAVDERSWEDPPMAGTTPPPRPPPDVRVTVSPTEGRAGSPFTFSYSCGGAHDLRVTKVDGTPAEGVTIGLATTGNGIDYTQSATVSVHGSYVGVAECDDLVGVSQPFVVSPDDVLSILVLGDSYSAGNGAGDYSDRDCWRSPNNYASQFQRLVESSSPDQQVFVENRACGGAVTADYWNPKDGRPAERDWVNNGYDAVFLNFGGNDIFFADIVRYCLVALFRDGATCNPNLGRAESLISDGTLEARLEAVLRDIRTRGNPYATIVLVGYPHLECDEAYTLRSGVGKNAPIIEVGRRVRQIVRDGDALQQRVVDRLNGALGGGFVFASTIDLFDGPPSHELCAKSVNKDRWMNQPQVDGGLKNREGWYHPNYTGHLEEAKMLFADVRIRRASVG